MLVLPSELSESRVYPSIKAFKGEAVVVYRESMAILRRYFSYVGQAPKMRWNKLSLWVNKMKKLSSNHNSSIEDTLNFQKHNQNDHYLKSLQLFFILFTIN